MIRINKTKNYKKKEMEKNYTLHWVKKTNIFAVSLYMLKKQIKPGTRTNKIEKIKFCLIVFFIFEGKNFVWARVRKKKCH